MKISLAWVNLMCWEKSQLFCDGRKVHALAVHPQVPPMFCVNCSVGEKEYKSVCRIIAEYS